MGDGPPHGFQGQVVDIPTVAENRLRRRGIEPRQQIAQGCLAGAGAADDAQKTARTDIQSDVAQGGSLLPGIAEG